MRKTVYGKIFRKPFSKTRVSLFSPLSSSLSLLAFLSRLPDFGIKGFQSIISRKIGISPHQFSVYLAVGDEGGGEHQHWKIPVTGKFNFAAISREKEDEERFFLVVLKRSRRERRRRTQIETRASLASLRRLWVLGGGRWVVGRWVVLLWVFWCGGLPIDVVADCGGLRLFMACGFLNTGHR
uniref:DUF7138 domain-containing protein n=1 Tax=Fagus sylvatica TaxID=28930 RepID=A0A2N9FCH5_FAGSY